MCTGVNPAHCGLRTRVYSTHCGLHTQGHIPPALTCAPKFTPPHGTCCPSLRALPLPCHAGEPGLGRSVLQRLLDRIREAVSWAGAAAGAGPDSLFELLVHEYVYCPDCNRSTHDARRVLHVSAVQVGLGKE